MTTTRSTHLLIALAVLVAGIFITGLTASAQTADPRADRQEARTQSLFGSPPLGTQIVCIVFTDLNDVGTPIPVLSAGECEDQGGHVSQCSDGVDNDSDGLIDAADPACHTDKDPDNGATYEPALDDESAEGSAPPPLPQCMNGIDDDSDGLVDMDDPGCHTDGDASNLASYVPGDNSEGDPVPPAPPENTLALCSDGIDNDSDGLTDLADPDCAAFFPALSVHLSILNAHEGTATTSDVELSVDGDPIADGTSTTTSPGSHTVLGILSTSTPYTVSYGGDCDGAGSVLLSIGDTKSCTVTVEDVAPPQCSDGLDNDSDGKVDADDPGCHTDGDAGNGGSYDPSLNDESASHSTGGGGGGGCAGINCGVSASGGNGPIVGSLGGGGGGPVTYGAVLGISTSSAEDFGPACEEYLTAFIKSGQANDPEQVRRLQIVLRDFEGAQVTVNGVYDAVTLAATRAFQSKYSADILTPWRLTSPTGFVYLTTRKKVNEIYCRNTRSFPLTSTEQSVIARALSSVVARTASAATVRSAPPQSAPVAAVSPQQPEEESPMQVTETPSQLQETSLSLGESVPEPPLAQTGSDAAGQASQEDGFDLLGGIRDFFGRLFTRIR